MSVIEVDDESLAVRLSLAEKMLALHGDLVVGRRDVVRAFSVEDPWRVLRGLRMPGTGVPFVLALGTWRHRAPEGGTGRDFVVVRGRGPAVVVDVKGCRFDRLLLSVEDPTELLDALRS